MQTANIEPHYGRCASFLRLLILFPDIALVLPRWVHP